MTVQELRIGNWVKDHTEIDNQVKAIGVGWIKFIDDDVCAVDLISGIPLTEEWLVKMGGQYTDEEYQFHIQDGEHGRLFVVKFVDGDWVLYEYNDEVMEPYQYLRCIEFVHLLQNAIYALTGQELPVK